MDWNCPTCNYKVFGSKKKCPKCRPDDWLCPTCKFNIFGSKSKCFKCGTLKPVDCSICFKPCQERYALNCGHTMCYSCSQRVGSTCPFCRQHITNVMKLF